MGKAKEEEPQSSNGVLEIVLKLKHGDDGKDIAHVKAEMFLPFLFEKEQLPMSEKRVVDTIDSIVNPFRVKMVAYLNEKLSEVHSQDQVGDKPEDTLVLEENAETETT